MAFLGLCIMTLFWGTCLLSNPVLYIDVTLSIYPSAAIAKTRKMDYQTRYIWTNCALCSNLQIVIYFDKSWAYFANCVYARNDHERDNKLNMLQLQPILIFNKHSGGKFNNFFYFPPKIHCCFNEMPLRYLFWSVHGNNL